MLQRARLAFPSNMERVPAAKVNIATVGMVRVMINEDRRTRREKYVVKPRIVVTNSELILLR